MNIQSSELGDNNLRHVLLVLRKRYKKGTKLKKEKHSSYIAPHESRIRVEYCTITVYVTKVLAEFFSHSCSAS